MQVWKETKLAPGTILMPGVISQTTSIVAHSELIARRLVDRAGIVGRRMWWAGPIVASVDACMPKLAGLSF
jgi:methionine synthase II (cobalamin-independent)